MSALDELVQILREVVGNPLETSDRAQAGTGASGHAVADDIRSQVNGAAQPDIREKYQELLQQAVSLQK